MRNAFAPRGQRQKGSAAALTMRQPEASYVNVINIHVGRSHGWYCGTIGRPREACLDCAGDPGLLHPLARGPRGPGLSHMEWTHGLLEARVRGPLAAERQRSRVGLGLPLVRP